MTFAQTITKLRSAADMSQQEVAERIKIARATYAGLETGRREPTLPEIRSLAQLYQVSPMELIESKLSKASQEAATIDIKPENSPKKDIEPRTVVKEDPRKLREVLLYVLGKVGAKPNVGETVLYKLLYFIDFDYYEKYGKSITGLTYVRNHFGPTPPKSQTFDGVVAAMKKADELEIINTKFFKHDQKKYLPNVQPSLEGLSAQELEHIDEELVRLGNKTATELTELSHKDIPWLASKDNKPIDYQLAMYRTSDTSVKEPEDEL